MNTLREIRQTLINKGKALKYLKPALGDIFRIELSILLVVQANNWNEDLDPKIQ
jgi:hypothetical protein